MADTPEPMERNGDYAVAADRIAVRQEKVATFLAARVPYRQMAESLGVGLATIQRDVETIREQWRAATHQAYSHHVVEEHARLNVLEGPFMAKALNGDVAAGHLVVRISESRRKLMGLDAPERHEHAFGSIADLEAYRGRVQEMIDAAFDGDDDVIDV